MYEGGTVKAQDMRHFLGNDLDACLAVFEIRYTDYA